MSGIRGVMLRAPVIPVLVIEDARHAVLIAEALVEGGLPVLEITLRTAAALDVLAAMAQVPGAFVGAGTVVTARGAEEAVLAGARFLVSPGLTASVADAAKALDVPLLPGVATAGDIMRGLDLGLDHFKFFPAEAAGGLRALKALAAPFGMARFCPTGGITAASAPEWLAHPSVLCVGGSWLVPAGAPDVAVIRARAREAAGFARIVA
jgi:2-dehydro-3-deoxyphosphogluconate aldolase/(4S)-4-hydroxy-2-oxoglutarate aldolase